MLNTFWNATKIDAMTAMLSQRVLELPSGAADADAPAGCGAPPWEPPFSAFRMNVITMHYQIPLA